jgi:hypothetical protein
MAFMIPNRPFATEPITGLMMPDGIFEASMGKQTINAHVRNGGSAEANVQVYIESISDPGIVITPATHFLTTAEGGVAHLFSWDADFTLAAPGDHLVSFIVETGAGDVRIIKKIFVAKAGYNPTDGTFSITCPEGVLTAEFREMVRPRDQRCCRRPKDDDCHCGCDGDEAQKPTTATEVSRPEQNNKVQNTNVLEYLVNGFKGHDPNFEFCLPEGYLPKDVKLTFTPTPAYTGQYGDLPFQDPWLKALFCVLALLLLIAAAIAEAVDGSGSITVTGGGGSGGGSGSSSGCCGVGASGGGTSYVAAGLLAAAAVCATLAAATGDARDSFRIGADNTAPASPSELTLSEQLELVYDYIEPIELGKPFKVKGDWKYARTTDVATYTHAQSDTTANVHLLSRYEINAPDIVRVYKREMFVIEASFFDADNRMFKGDQLFVQCFLIGPSGQWRKIIMQDNGMPANADKKANDGIYTGRHFFTSADKGIWTYFVIAQDINNAQPDMKPEEAAQIIGGMVLTNQLIITFEGGTCQFVPDGHVNVIAQ